MNYSLCTSKEEFQMEISRRWKDVAEEHLKEYDVHTVSGFVRYMIWNRKARFGNRIKIKAIYASYIPMFKEAMISVLKAELPGFPVNDMVDLFMELYTRPVDQERVDTGKLLCEFWQKCKIIPDIPLSFFC